VVLTFAGLGLLGGSASCSAAKGDSPGADASTDGSEGGAIDGSSGDGGSSGGGAAEFLADLEIFRNGGTIAALGGFGPIQVVVDGSGTHISVAGAKGTHRLQIEWTSAGSYTLAGDINADGKVDDQKTVTTTGGVTTTVWELDDNLNGGFNWRNTVTNDGKQITSKIEAIPFLGTTYATLSSYSAPALEFEANCNTKKSPEALGMGEACDPNAQVANFPSTPTFCQKDNPSTTAGGCSGVHFDGPNPWSKSYLNPAPLFSGHATPFFEIRSHSMACNPMQKKMLVEALEEATGRFLSTMPALNGDRFTDVMKGLGKLDGIYYGCALPSSAAGCNVLAVTGPSELTDSPNSKITTLDPSIFTAGQDALEEILIHEWFHAAGISHPDDPNGSSQRDFIYSCSRVVDQCKAYDSGFYLGFCCDASSARDHAMCADVSNKGQFGVQLIFRETADGIIEEPTGLSGFDNKGIPGSCVDEMNQAASCQCMIEQVPAYCDQVTITEQTADSMFGTAVALSTLTLPNCCESCPAGSPYASIPPCGTVDPTSDTECPPMSTCTVLPTTGGTARGPTPKYRFTLPAIAAGQAVSSSPTSKQYDCQPVSGCNY
jgi:hypothetical protein